MDFGHSKINFLTRLEFKHCTTNRFFARSVNFVTFILMNEILSNTIKGNQAKIMQKRFSPIISFYFSLVSCRIYFSHREKLICVQKFYKNFHCFFSIFCKVMADNQAVFCLVSLMTQIHSVKK